MSILGKNKGFTLVEILLVVAIMGILSVTATISVTATVGKMKFQNVVDKVEQMVFDARSMALNGKQILDCSDADHDGLKEEAGDKVVAAGYGLNISGNAFVLFDDSHGFSTGKYVPPVGDECGDVVESVYELPGGFSVEVLPPNTTDFVYLPPDAAFKTNAASPPDNNYEIKISNDKFVQEITIGLAGVPGRGLLEMLP